MSEGDSWKKRDNGWRERDEEWGRDEQRKRERREMTPHWGFGLLLNPLTSPTYN